MNVRSLADDWLPVAVGHEIGSLLHGSNAAGAAALSKSVLPCAVAIGVVVDVGTVTRREKGIVPRRL